MTELRQLLCPIDFSEASRQALDQAIAIAGRYESQLHTVTPAFTVEPPILFAERGNLEQLGADTDQIGTSEATGNRARDSLARRSH